MSTKDKQTNLTAEEAVLEHGCYNCSHVRLDKTCNVYCQLRAEGGRCEAYNSWTSLPEPCEDCVSRQAVMQTLYDYGCESEMQDAIAELPSVQPKQKTGYWISWYEIIEEEWGTEHNPHCKCSECSTEVDPHTSKFINCCPVCGAKMVGYKKREEKE